MTLKDLTLNEADEVNSLLSFSDAGAAVSNENSIKFLSITLRPSIQGKKIKDIDFGNCTETTALEVLKDFFTKRIESGQDLKNYFVTFIKKQKK